MNLSCVLYCVLGAFWLCFMYNMTSLFFQGRGGCHLDLFSCRPSGHDCCLLFPYHCGDVRILWNSEKKSVASCMGMVVYIFFLLWVKRPTSIVLFFSSAHKITCLGNRDSRSLICGNCSTSCEKGSVLSMRDDFSTSICCPQMRRDGNMYAI